MSDSRTASMLAELPDSTPANSCAYRPNSIPSSGSFSEASVSATPSAESTGDPDADAVLAEMTSAVEGEAGTDAAKTSAVASAHELSRFFMSVDWTRYSSEGVVDLPKVEADLEFRSAAGELFQKVMGMLVHMRETQLENKSELRMVHDNERAQLIRVLCALISNAEVTHDTARGRSIVRNSILAWGRGGREIAQTIASKFSRIPDFAPTGKLVRGVQSFLNLAVITAEDSPLGRSALGRCLLADWTPNSESRPN